MAKNLAGKTFQQVTMYCATSQFFADDQAEASTGTAPGAVMQIEAAAAQNATGGEYRRKLIRLVQPVTVAKTEV